MIESNDEMRLREAVSLIRCAGWISAAASLESGARTPAATLVALRRVIGDDRPDAYDAAAIAALEALVGAPVPNERDHAVDALTEARAKCDELRDSLASTQATLDEALRVQGAIWNAVGGQRDGESLVDAVRRVARLASDPGPRAEVSASAQYASYVTEADRAAPTTAHPLADAIAGLSLDEIAALSAAGWVMRWTAPSMRWVTPGGAALDPATWRETLRREAARLLGKRYVVGVEGGAVMVEAKMGELDGVLSEASKRVAEWPEWKQSDDVKRRREEFDARVEAMCAKRCTEHDSLLISGDGVVARIEAQRVRELDAAREAGRAEMRTERDAMQAQIDDARKALGAHGNETLFGAATEAKAEVERLRMVLLDIGRALDHRSPEHIVDTAKRVVAERDAAYQRGQEEMRERAAKHCAEVSMARRTIGKYDEAIDLLGAHYAIRSISIAKTPTASASEVTGEAIPGAVSAETAGAGESVARSAGDAAEIARLRRQVEQLDNRSHNRGRDLERWAEATDASSPEQAEQDIAHLREQLDAAKESRDEHLVNRDAARKEIARLRVEIDRLNRCWRDSMEQLAEESERWCAATGCESPAKASAFVARINEAAKLLRD